MQFDFDTLRVFVLHCPASPPVRRLRLALFDLYRYEEDYENLYKLVINLGGVIE